MSAIYLRCGSFHVALDSDALEKMPRSNFRKLLKLVRTEIRNTSSLQELGRIMRQKAADANAAHTKAKEEFVAGWKYVDKRSRTKSATETMQENNRLQNAVKRTKAELNAAEALLKIFNEMEIYEYGSSYS